jgi:DNA-binding beta-propeller fold protein YncE
MQKFIFLYLVFIQSFCFTNEIIDTSQPQILCGNKTKLSRPEGIVFSPCGKYIVAPNTGSHSITFHEVEKLDSQMHNIEPCFEIKGKKTLLNYPHDIAFTPDGKYLAVSNRRSNLITIYEKNLETQFYYEKPKFIIGNKGCRLAGPDSIRFSPNGNILAVANSDLNQILLFNCQDDEFSKTPYQIIQNVNGSINLPDGINFSQDGNLIAITNHMSHSVSLFEKVDETGYYSILPVQQIYGLVYPHSLCFFCEDQYLAVTCSQGTKNLIIYKKSKEANSYYDEIAFQSAEVTLMYDEQTISFVEKLHREGGCKGIAVSPDGLMLAVSQNLNIERGAERITKDVIAIFRIKNEN